MGVIEKAAIFGAAGAIGPYVAAELERRGVPFRVVGRRRAVLEQEFGNMAHAEIFDADLSDLRSAGAAARGVDTIIYSVGLPYPSHRLHPELMRTTLEAASKAGVQRIVLVSSVYGYGAPQTARVAETHPRQPHTRKGKYRKEQEDLVTDATQRGHIQGLIVRLPDFYGPHADNSYAGLIFRAALAGKTVNWPGPVNTAHEFVYVPDSGPVIVDLASAPDAYGQAWNYGGPGQINTLDFITRVYRAAGRAPKYRAAGPTILKMIGWFNPTVAELPEMLYLQETPVILDDSKLLARFPQTAKTPYDEGIHKTLEWAKSHPTNI